MSAIEWADKIWNPITGCGQTSATCLDGYDPDIAKRFWANNPYAYVQFHPERLGQPLKWKKPARISVNPRSDLFHGLAPDEQLDQIFAVMARTPRHTYQILTKRPQRMLIYLEGLEDRIEKSYLQPPHERDRILMKISNRDRPLSNLWLGVGIENHRAVCDRARFLHKISQRGWKTFYSVESLLQPVDLWLKSFPVDWVIVESELCSDAENIRDVVWQCQSTQTPVFVKQGEGNGTEKFPDDLKLREVPTLGRKNLG